MPTLTLIDCGNDAAVANYTRTAAVMAAVRMRCTSRGLSEMERIRCENVARDALNDGSSPAAAIAAGNDVAEKFSNRQRTHSWRGGPSEPKPAA